MSHTHRGWYRLLNRYHWFVLGVAALGWLFDTMDQQLFNLARQPAMEELLGARAAVDGAFYGGLATSIFLIGWGTGGLIFGVLGDRLGRAKTMLLTILLYSFCTGLSALSKTYWDFVFYRFLTGLGVGGEFGVGVSLVAEVMPEAARPFALGFLQALSAIGNMTASVVGIVLGLLQQDQVFNQWQIGGIHVTPWRLMFVVGALPALLAVPIRRRLKEPERWKQAAARASAGKRLGSYSELLGDPLWRRRAIVGMLLVTSGVIGVWGIAFFAQDLGRSVFRKLFESEARQQGEAQRDRDFIGLVLRDPTAISKFEQPVHPSDLISLTANDDAPRLYGAIQKLMAEKRPVSIESVLAVLDLPAADNARKFGQTAQERQRRRQYLATPPSRSATVQDHARRIALRTHEIEGQLTLWSGYTLLMLHFGALLGMYSFAIVTNVVGRRAAFALGSVSSMLSTAMVFWYMNSRSDVFWMMPVMGFCQLFAFGGYAIYLPELFPTRLRSTGTSFCYNVGRYLAAAGPLTLGYLAGRVFNETAEPLRYAGVSMCLIFVLGLVVLPFAPETRGQPLPE